MFASARLRGIGGEIPPPLDLVGTSVGAYSSSRRASRGWGTAAVLRIRRASDNAEQDISARRYRGRIDSDAIATFISGTTGAHSKRYDMSGNTHDLVQATAGAQPLWQTDGSALFDGVNDFMKATTFTLSQAETVYIYARQVTWTAGLRIFDGNAINSGGFFQNDNGNYTGTSPYVQAFAGAYFASAPTNMNLWTLNTYASQALVFNGVSSVYRIGTTEVTGDVGGNNMAGFTLGAVGGGGANWSNVQSKEELLYSGAHTAAQRALLTANQAQALA